MSKIRFLVVGAGGHGQQWYTPVPSCHLCGVGCRLYRDGRRNCRHRSPPGRQFNRELRHRVDHHAVVEDFGHLGVRTSMAGGMVLGRGAQIQAGAVVGYEVKLAAGEVLLTGAARECKLVRSIKE